MLKNLFAVASLATLVFTSVAVTAHRRVDADIVDTAISSKQFPTLVALLKKADLVETLKSEGPFTVFAPTEAAFKKVDKATLAKLGHDKELLKKVLLYHVVAGKVMASSVVTMDGKSVKTVEGASVKIRVGKKGGVKVNNAKVVKTDIVASNGVIHVIDTVLIPPMKSSKY